MPPAYIELRQREPLICPGPNAPLRRLAATKRVVRVLDLLEEPARGQLAALAGARSQVLVPMLKADELVGAIVMYRREVRAFTDRQIALLQINDPPRLSCLQDAAAWHPLPEYGALSERRGPDRAPHAR